MGSEHDTAPAEVPTILAEAAQPQGPPTVTIGSITATLVEPTSLFALACSRTDSEVERGGFAETLAYAAAAVRMCWPPGLAWPAKPRPREWTPARPMLEYGAEVWEGLRAGTKGVTGLTDLIDAAIRAHNWAVSTAMTEAEVKASEDFSAGQEGDE